MAVTYVRNPETGAFERIGPGDSATDITLSVSGKAADAKIVGQTLAGKIAAPVNTAEIGQALTVSAIDEEGKAIAWETTNMPSIEGLATIAYVDENKVTVDAELSTDSENPVQNMVVAMAIDEAKVTLGGQIAQATASVVEYTEQTLTEEQMTQARANIGAANEVTVDASIGQINGKIDEINGTLSGHTTSIEEINGDIEVINTDVDTLKTNVSNLNTLVGETAVATQISTAIDGLANTYVTKEESQATETRLNEKISAIESDYLKAADKTELEGKIETNASAIARLTNGVSAEEVDGVNDLIQYVKDHGTEVTGMKADIQANADAIAAFIEVSEDEINALFTTAQA